MVYMPYNKYRYRIMEKIQMDKFEVEFYAKSNGEKPAKDFILSLDAKMKAKAYRKDFLERVKNNE